eukprot:793519-Rhodomonas_salina.5
MQVWPTCLVPQTLLWSLVLVWCAAVSAGPLNLDLNGRHLLDDEEATISFESVVVSQSNPVAGEENTIQLTMEIASNSEALASPSTITLSGLTGFITAENTRTVEVLVEREVDSCVSAGGARHGDTCFSVITGGKTFVQAEAACGNLGGTLATIASESASDVVIKLVEPLFSSATQFWIGLNDIDDAETSLEGQWTWLDGSPYMYTNWLSREPDNRGVYRDGRYWRTATQADCVHFEITYSGERNVPISYWRDESCFLSANGLGELWTLCSKLEPVIKENAAGFCVDGEQGLGEWSSENSELVLTLCPGEVMRPKEAWTISFSGGNSQQPQESPSLFLTVEPTTSPKSIQPLMEKATGSVRGVTEGAAPLLIVCAAGQTFQSSVGLCVPCQEGTFKQNPGQQPCSPCYNKPEHAVYTDTGIPSSFCPWTCAAGYERSGGACLACTAGMYKAEQGDESCTTCANTKPPHSAFSSTAVQSAVCPWQCIQGFEPLAGQSMCVCSAGSHLRGQACVPCEIGEFKSDLTEDRCTACNNKPNNSEYTEVGAKVASCPWSCNAGFIKDDRDNECECPAGSVMSDNGLSCICRPGFTLDGSSCKPCMPGTFKSSKGSAQCSQCSNLKPVFSDYVTDGMTENECPWECSAGTVQRTDDCVCAKGHTLENGQCKSCSAGTFKDVVGNHACQDCTSGKPPGSSYDGNGGTTAVCAWTCSAGFKSVGDECQACPRGKFKVARGPGQCASCGNAPPNSTYAETGGSSADCAWVCLAGFAPFESEGVSTCMACKAGAHKPFDGNQGCLPCPWSEQHKGPASTECLQTNGYRLKVGEGKWVESSELPSFHSFTLSLWCLREPTVTANSRSGSQRTSNTVPYEVVAAVRDLKSTSDSVFLAFKKGTGGPTVSVNEVEVISGADSERADIETWYWIHWVVTFRAETGEVQLYRNGVFEQYGSDQTTQTPYGFRGGRMYLGMDPAVPQNSAFSGQIDDVMFFTDLDLAPLDVLKLFNTGTVEASLLPSLSLSFSFVSAISGYLEHRGSYTNYGADLMGLGNVVPSQGCWAFPTRNPPCPHEVDVAHCKSFLWGVLAGDCDSAADVASQEACRDPDVIKRDSWTVSYTHLRAHETEADL